MGAEQNYSENSANAERLQEIMNTLARVNAMLRSMNEENGNLARYRSMRKEIKTLGWSGIVQRYHPDINVKDPASYELFALYRFVYQTMQKE